MSSPNNPVANRHLGAIGPRATTDANVPLSPSFVGYIGDTISALKLLELCLLGQINHMPRRPGDQERAELIKSGHIFIYDEQISGIKRWTDGHLWSPSRIQEPFLLYREIKGAFKSGEKKKALKKNNRASTNERDTTGRKRSSTPLGVDSDRWRELVGSLLESYDFKENGLIKKTLAVKIDGKTHHIVSYYNPLEVAHGTLQDVAKQFEYTWPRPSLLAACNAKQIINLEIQKHFKAGYYVPETVVYGMYHNNSGQSHHQQLSMSIVTAPAHHTPAAQHGPTDWTDGLHIPVTHAGFEIQPAQQYGQYMQPQVGHHQQMLLEEQEFGLHPNAQQSMFDHAMNSSMVPRNQSFVIGSEIGYGPVVDNDDDRRNSVPNMVHNTVPNSIPATIPNYNEEDFHGLPNDFYNTAYGAGPAHQEYVPQEEIAYKIENGAESVGSGQQHHWTNNA
ncbi:Gti1/Pac2 family-domain-containing protein [Cladorrhinum sp. PSN259]|nr:Gti1/Pac2 family-domain-containing protein [Cladorrhinum sp. PSN259]